MFDLDIEKSAQYFIPSCKLWIQRYKFQLAQFDIF